ncbi:MAG TPA: acetoin utilization protein AcuC [Gammaproteobacteria bacterium]|nr:acetoin utilization protein AcuC [Gammaproteobacteria bacterium]
MSEAAVYAGKKLADYHFGPDHPFGPYRYSAFMERFHQNGLDQQVAHEGAYLANDDDMLLFHTPEFLAEIKRRSVEGTEHYGSDTPMFIGAYDVASTVVGTVIRAVDDLMDRRYRRAFVPIGGLHHGGRGSAAGFCLLNDCGVAIEVLKQRYGMQRVAYIDIDAHHGDGVFYAFEFDPGVIIADIHEDGRSLYPGTGDAEETGRGKAIGTKLNLPMKRGANDTEFMAAWDKVELFLLRLEPEFIIMQSGADCLAGDPLTHLKFTEEAHRHATTRLRIIADECSHGRLLVTGGGGYDADNIAAAWGAVVEALV